jgi:hypothetical protein
MLPSGACGSIGGNVEATSIDGDDLSGDESTGLDGPQFRYGVVFLLMLTLVVFLIATPDAAWSRAIATVISGAALVVAITTARVRKTQRRGGIVVVIVATAAVGGAVIAEGPDVDVRRADRHRGAVRDHQRPATPAA